jgi:hypothetical protein
VSTDTVAALRHDDGGAAMGAAIADSASHGRLLASRRATSLLDGVFITNSFSILPRLNGRTHIES